MDQKYDWTEVVGHIQDGDEAAFQILYSKTRDFIFNQIRYEYGFSEHDAEDILQDVYSIVYKNIGSLKNPNAVITWISQICRNQCNEVYRKNNRRKEIADIYTESDLATEDEDFDDFSIDQLGAVNNVEEYIERKEVQRLVGEMISELSQDQQICIVMQMQQYSIQEIAEQTGMKENTVKTNIRRAKDKVKEKVLALEKKGTKLYGLAPIPFLWFLLRKLLAGDSGITEGMRHADLVMACGAAAGAGAATAAGTANATGTGTLTGAAAGGASTAAGTAGAAAGKAGAFLATTAGKAAAIVAAVVIIGAGVTAGIVIHNQNSAESVQVQDAYEEPIPVEEEPEYTRADISDAFLQFLENQDVYYETFSSYGSLLDFNNVSIEYGNDQMPPMLFYKSTEPTSNGYMTIRMAVFDKGEILEILNEEQFLDLFEGADSEIQLSQPNLGALGDMHTDMFKLKGDDSVYIYWRRGGGSNYLDQYVFSDGRFHLFNRIEGMSTHYGPSGSSSEKDQSTIDAMLENAEKLYVSLISTAGHYYEDNEEGFDIEELQNNFCCLSYDAAAEILKAESEE